MTQKLQDALDTYMADEETDWKNNTPVVTRVRTRDPETVSEIMRSIATDLGKEIIFLGTVDQHKPTISELSKNRVLGKQQGILYKFR